MAPRHEVNGLQVIALNELAFLVQTIVQRVSTQIVHYHNECIRNNLEKKLASSKYQVHTNDDEKGTKNDASKQSSETLNANSSHIEEVEDLGIDETEEDQTNYRLNLLNDFVERLRQHIFSHVPYNLVEDVTQKVCQA